MYDIIIIFRETFTLVQYVAKTDSRESTANSPSSVYIATPLTQVVIKWST